MLCLGFTSLLVLVLGTSSGTAFPRDALKKGCSLSKYRFPVPHELQAVWKLKKQFEDIMPLSDHKCHTRLFHRKWKVASLSVLDRVKLVEAELDFAISMLELPADPRFAKTRWQPLAFLTQVQEDLRGCMDTEALLHQPSGKVRHWLHKLQEAKESRGVGCLEASAILHLFQILHDLQCVALWEQCT
ncbi:PREDICTED: interferon lambda-3-like [Apaloderma vittatum]|uniref:interferon lambda-3-like n=1 Tax=Apaloderma vittatum TaxID=57397 RepID=UPI000521A241|nr:PREDICTED: interferon lambda-3-like [Apaloderma vittatum]